MMNPQCDFAADFQFRAHEFVESVVDHSFGGVLDGHHAIGCGAGFHFPEHLADGRHGFGLDRMPEVLERRRLGEGTLRPQEGNGHHLFQRQAGGHDLAEQARHFLIAEGALVAFHHLAQNLRLPFGAVERVVAPALLGLANLLGNPGARGDQFLDLLVQLIDLLPQVVEVVAHGVLLCLLPVVGGWRVVSQTIIV
jgi:hypothetical protein